MSSRCGAMIPYSWSLMDSRIRLRTTLLFASVRPVAGLGIVVTLAWLPLMGLVWEFRSKGSLLAIDPPHSRIFDAGCRRGVLFIHSGEELTRFVIFVYFGQLFCPTA